jgi:phosphate transport system substrate-binding protein
LRWLLALGVGLLALPGCGGCGGPRLTGGGSSFVNPMMLKWAAEYKAKKGVSVDYTSSGSGNGIKNMIGGQNQFGCTDAPMSEEQLQEAGGPDAVIHVPLVMGAVVPIYNLEGVEGLKLTGEVLAEIFLGNIEKWNEKPIADLNPGVKLPDKPVAVVHRADGSGTSYIFTDYLSQVSEGWKKGPGKGTNPTWPKGDRFQGVNKNDGVAKAVSDTPGAIGYVELLYALQNEGKLKVALVSNAAGEYVPASLKSVTAAADAMLTEIKDDLRFSIVNPPKESKGAYPICGTVWAVAKVKQPNADKAKLLADFLRWCVTDGQGYAEALHYARLPEGLVKRAQKKIDLLK